MTEDPQTTADLSDEYAGDVGQMIADARAALDRIEAVVKAARDVRYDVMNEGFLSQATSDQVHAALEALDSQEERTP